MLANYLIGLREAKDGPGGRQNGADGPVVVKLGTWLDNVQTGRETVRTAPCGP
ncbi:hypothetical protein ACFU9W_44655 [Streptomyces sp. NPDC057600]|uniref:hypothetical protein n=1 Tax=Streptomyces sp. NPDC057600 TaxID=3346180 RepID=UPI0036910FC2